MILRILPLTAAILICCGPASPQKVADYGYEIVHTYPHDTSAFTEGLFYLDGFLYESTGIEGQSSIRKVRLETGEVVQRFDIPPQYFGEGMVNWKDRLIQLTYTTQVGFVYDLAGFRLERQFEYSGEGWALTQDGKRIIMSDGTPEIRFWDPDTLRETGRITVMYQGQPLKNVNELEWVNGEIYANVWKTKLIVRINPSSGQVAGVIDLNGLLSRADITPGHTDVMNGIAYDAQGGRLFVTGKYWPKIFEIRLVKR